MNVVTEICAREKGITIHREREREKDSLKHRITRKISLSQFLNSHRSHCCPLLLPLYCEFASLSLGFRWDHNHNTLFHHNAVNRIFQLLFTNAMLPTF
ncbi:hypothetical protein VNO78_21937 [Psophocarpus tetragonolobus]|uniref:Uncharacterized protein n=1 Tax=Psophocarpus tetragonolobus TaxID=3891 RepID=A0AAN9XIH9_PSOTE